MARTRGPRILRALSTSGPDGSSQGQEASTFGDDETNPVTCNPVGGGGSGGTSCETLDSETCSNGANYGISCTCPDGTCVCSGSSGGPVRFAGCPSCPFADREPTNSAVCPITDPALG